jgi:hypothetical protein
MGTVGESTDLTELIVGWLCSLHLILRGADEGVGRVVKLMGSHFVKFDPISADAFTLPQEALIV